MKKRYLVLQDGTIFEGYAFGADKCTVGELIFSTNVVGYIETLTDPCYYGQIIVQTFPMMGNYGIIESDFIGEAKLSGYVVREYCDYPSNFRCEYDLDTFLKNNGIPAIYGVDTREITTIIRDKGTMNAALCDEIPADMAALESYRVVDAVKNTSTKEVSVFNPKGDIKGEIAVLDMGSSKNIEIALMDKGYKVTVLPYDTKAEDILNTGAKALLVTEGPGNPEEVANTAAEIAKLSGKIAILGIGLGHQLMAMAHGAEIIKLHHGHHGGNQPSKVVGTARTLITSQNFGYAVDADTLKCGEVTHKNMNDGVCEGIKYSEKEFSVQFTPSEEWIADTLIELA
ncbi:MAG: carbamoyl phosphate synthase small subunit [Clostridia bacterium]|nr:carbamoyl phosphate synthase small subunit [Clostridia bacterium]